MTTITHEMVNTKLTIALERTWRCIRKAHPDVPPVVITIGSGAEKGKPGLKLGHFAAARWEHDGAEVSELFIAGEGLRQGPIDVLDTLLHEAAHGVGATRGIKNTSRQGRYHNKQFKILAEELGLEVTETKKDGWSNTTVAKPTLRVYRRYLGVLERALVLWRRIDDTSTERPNGNNNGISLTCPCPRRIRVSNKVHDEGPILCGNCDTPFTPDEDPNQDTDEG